MSRYNFHLVTIWQTCLTTDQHVCEKQSDFKRRMRLEHNHFYIKFFFWWPLLLDVIYHAYVHLARCIWELYSYQIVEIFYSAIIIITPWPNDKYIYFIPDLNTAASLNNIFIVCSIKNTFFKSLFKPFPLTVSDESRVMICLRWKWPDGWFLRLFNHLSRRPCGFPSRRKIIFCVPPRFYLNSLLSKLNGA